MKPSTFFSVALAIIAGVSARPAEMPTPSSSLTATTPTSAPALGVGGPSAPAQPSDDNQDINSRGTNCSGPKQSACCDEVKGLCNVLVENRACPVSSMYCCDFSGNKGIQVNIMSCSQVVV